MTFVFLGNLIYEILFTYRDLVSVGAAEPTDLRKTLFAPTDF